MVSASEKGKGITANLAKEKAATAHLALLNGSKEEGKIAKVERRWRKAEGRRKSTPPQ